MSYYKPDLVLLHAPSVYDFRKKTIMYGPISDVIPSTPVFEMYPIGFSSISEYLSQNSLRVRIINLAYHMLEDRKYDVEKTIKKLKCRAFGIDLHWLPHAHGSLEVAKICKQHHPDIPVIMGGYSATYFDRELIDYPQVDYVVRGDSAEETLLQVIMNVKKGKKNFSAIPNLTFKDEKGIHRNPLSHTVSRLDEFSNNYLNLIKSSLLYRDPKGFTAIHDWWKYPITAIMTCRGCVHNCVFCGGSQYGVKKYCKRTAPAFRPPELIAKDIHASSRYTNGPIFVVGDLRQGGKEYAKVLLNQLKKIKPANQIVLEHFEPASREYFEMVAESIPNFNFEFSPESHLEEIRKSSGKTYRNKELEETIGHALECGCQKFDLFFMIGLPQQTAEKALDTVDYCKDLLKKFGRRLNPFISPLAPFIDPGSLAYEESEKFGYKIFYRTLEEYRQALLLPSWKYTLGYETRWMTRDEIVATTYQAALRLNQVKAEFGLIDSRVARKVDERIKEAVTMMKRIDELMEEKNAGTREEQLNRLKPQIDQLSISTICEKDEIKWPAGKRRFNYFNIIKDVFFKRVLE
jgi:B12-binding domain/radical SAM domain protein